MTTDHKPLVAIISKDVAMLSQDLHTTCWALHQYRVCILNKPYSNLCIVDWLPTIQLMDTPQVIPQKNLCTTVSSLITTYLHYSPILTLPPAMNSSRTELGELVILQPVPLDYYCTYLTSQLGMPLETLQQAV